MPSNKREDQKYHVDNKSSYRTLFPTDSEANDSLHLPSHEAAGSASYYHESINQTTQGCKASSPCSGSTKISSVSVASGNEGSTERGDPDLRIFLRDTDLDETTEKLQYMGGTDVSGLAMVTDHYLPMERFLKSVSWMDKFVTAEEMIECLR